MRRLMVNRIVALVCGVLLLGLVSPLTAPGQSGADASPEGAVVEKSASSAADGAAADESAAAKEAYVQEAEAAAQEAALAWLALVDEKRYEESWEETAKSFQREVGKTQWRLTLESGRAPMGDVVQRTLRSAMYATSLPGAPDGEYVVLRFNVEYTKKKSGIETVTPELQDGVWRVSGYYIH